MAILSGSIAYTLWARAQRTIEIGEAAVFSYLYPIFAAPLAVFWLKEKITMPFVIGATVIAVGVFIAEYRSSRRGQAKSS
jgi:drug/metabolite transporter (DMT)-like permease